VILISLIAESFGSKLVTGDPPHCLQHTFIGDASKAQMTLDHLLPEARVNVSIGRKRGGKSHPYILFLALPDAYIEAHNAVLVAGTLHRKVSIEVVLTLDDLL